jgi:hypothetical protein
MTGGVVLSSQQLDRIRAAAIVLLPGSAESPAAIALPDFDELVQQAAAALEGDDRGLAAAVEALPADPSWDGLSAFAELDPTSFEQVSLLMVGAYFMSPAVLASLHLPTGERRPARPEQVVDELSTGILDPVFARGCPIRTLDDVNTQQRRIA